MFSGLSAVLLLSGCMGYRLGGGRPEGIKTVSLAPIVNLSGEPAIELQVTHALRDRIQFDGRLQLADSNDDADGVIEVTLISYNLVPVAFRYRQQATPQMYRLRITGRAILKRSDTGKVIATSSTYGESTFRFQSDLTTSKRNALPDAAAEIAKYMVDDLIEQW